MYFCVHIIVERAPKSQLNLLVIINNPRYAEAEGLSYVINVKGYFNPQWVTILDILLRPMLICFPAG